MVAALAPQPLPERAEYIGFRLVSDDDFDGWVRQNVDRLFHNFALGGGLDLDKLAAFSAKEWQAQRDRCEGYANVLRMHE